MEYAVARHNMVESQIRAAGVSDRAVLAALEEIPREVFLPKALRSVAYADDAPETAGGRLLLEPRVFASLLQAAAINPDDAVLDLACGLGYSTAVLSRLASSVVAVESDADLVAQASSILADLGVDNAAVVEGSLSQGYPSQGPYTVILVNGGVEFVPEALLSQLEDCGRLVAVLVREGIGQGVVYSRQGDAFGCRPLFNAAAPMLPEFAILDRFVF